MKKVVLTSALLAAGAAVSLALGHAGEATAERMTEGELSMYEAEVPAAPDVHAVASSRFTVADLSNQLTTSDVKVQRAAAQSAADYTGVRQLMSRNYSSHTLNGNEVSVTALEGDTLLISPFYFKDVAIKAVPDYASGTFEIPAGQQISYVEGAGRVCMAKMNFSASTFDPTAAIKGTLSNGSMHIDDGYGFFVTEGPSLGAYLNIGLMEFGVVAKPNAQLLTNVISFAGDGNMTTENRTVSPVSTFAYAYPTVSDRVRLMHVPAQSNYTDLLLSLSPGNKVQIDPQRVYAAALVGEFCYYGMEEKVNAGKVTFSIKMISPLEVSYDSADLMLTWGGSGIANTSGNRLLGAYESTSVLLDTPLSFPAAIDTKFEGEGTAENPWLIKSADDLLRLRADITTNTAMQGPKTTDENGNWSIPVYEGRYFKLANDIDMSTLTSTFSPIGGKEYWFSGTLDGAGHTISGLKFVDYAYDYCGLFGTLGYTSKVTNLKLADIDITSLGYTAGALAGRSAGEVSNVEVSNAKVYVTSGYNAGSLLGYSYGKLENITVTGANVAGLGYLGGLVGRSFGDVKSCHVAGRVVMTGTQSFSGGIIGMQIATSLSAPTPVVSDCYFSGTVSATGNQIGIGGIAGGFSYSKLERSFASAQIVNSSNVQSYVGGLIGTSFKSELTDCYVSGFVRNAYTGNCGGLIGHNTTSASSDGTTVVTNCYSSAMLYTDSEEDTRGLVGSISGIKLVNSYYDAQIASVANAEYGLSTSAMTSAGGLKGFSADVWNFTAGLYPRLKGIDNNDAAHVSASALTLADKDNLQAVGNDFKVSLDNDVQWLGVRNGLMNPQGGYAFSFDNGAGRLNYEQYTDTIFVAKNSVNKYYIANISPILFQGEGTMENPWRLSTREDVQKFSAITNNATQHFLGNYFVLTADIDMQGDTIVPFCKDPKAELAFRGTFDGAGHTIDNFVVSSVVFYDESNATAANPVGKVNSRDNRCYYYSGLFANVGAEGTVKNLTVGPKAIYDLFCYGGAIAGGSQGVIENCANYGSVTTYSMNSGGIVGYAKKGSVTRGCYNGGKVIGGLYNVGGIVGLAENAVVENCENTGYVSARFVNVFQKDGSQYAAGGIVGKATSTTITNVVNSGVVESYKQVGGIAGNVMATAAAPGVMTNAVNYGLNYSWKEKPSIGALVGTNVLGQYANCYVDKQIQALGLVAAGNMDGVTALTVADLTSGKLELPDSVWAQGAGVYPSMKYDKTPAQVAVNTKAVVNFVASDRAKAMVNDAALAEGVAWSLRAGKAFSIKGSKLSAVVPDQGVANDTLVATLGNAVREIPVATLNVNVLEGEGTEQSPYLIKTAADFLAVAAFMDASEYDYEGHWFKVTDDLDFTGQTFTPMGNVVAFNGTVLGNDKTLKGVSYTGTTSADLNHGVFATLGMNGTVRDLILDKTSVISAYTNAGGIVGALYGTVDNCKNYATVSTTGNISAGGVAGLAYRGASIARCVNYGAVTAKSNYAGGILGSAAASASVPVSFCSNYGSVNGVAKNGGIVGSASADVTRCVNYGAVNSSNASNSYAAGIIGEGLLPTSVTYSHNEGAITGTQYIAGVIGMTVAHPAATPCVIDSCYNTADLTIGAKGYSAGVAANLGNGFHMTRCYNTGNIVGKTASNYIRLAGVVSSPSSSATIKSHMIDCWNSGDITGYTNLGGLVGSAAGDSLRIIRCYNTGNVTGGGTTATASNNTGGIWGNGKANVTDCWNSGDVTGSGQYVGGLNGYNTGGETMIVARNFNVGTVKSAGAIVGGIIGMGRATITSNVNYGSVVGSTNVAGVLGQPGLASAASYHVVVRGNVNAGKVASAPISGNILNNNTGCKFLTVGSNWYDATVSPEASEDSRWEGITGLTTAEMTAADFGEDFVLATATYPMLKSHINNKVQAFHAATLLLAQGESLDSISSPFMIGTPAGVEWTCTPNLTISGNQVTVNPTADKEEATLTIKAGELERTYTLTIYKPTTTGIDSVNGEREVLMVKYYLTNGTEVATPAAGMGVIIERTIYTDGTQSTRKYVAQ